jgi:hypothetical protein
MSTPEQSFEVPSLTDQLGPGEFTDVARLAYWLGVNRANARAHHVAKRFPMRDGCAQEAERLLSELKAELAKERQS